MRAEGESHDAAGTRLKIDDDGLVELLLQIGLQRARVDADTAARAIRHDQVDRPRRIARGVRATRQQHAARRKQNLSSLHDRFISLRCSTTRRAARAAWFDTLEPDADPCAN